MANGGRRLIVVVGYERENYEGALAVINNYKKHNEHIPEVRMQTYTLTSSVIIDIVFVFFGLCRAAAVRWARLALLSDARRLRWHISPVLAGFVVHFLLIRWMLGYFDCILPFKRGYSLGTACSFQRCLPTPIAL